jgi:hypothetical protein
MWFSYTYEERKVKILSRLPQRLVLKSIPYIGTPIVIRSHVRDHGSCFRSPEDITDFR